MIFSFVYSAPCTPPPPLLCQQPRSKKKWFTLKWNSLFPREHILSLKSRSLSVSNKNKMWGKYLSAVPSIYLIHIFFFQVVHNYGHSNDGIALSWGTALEATELTLELLAGRSSRLWFKNAFFCHSDRALFPLLFILILVFPNHSLSCITNSDADSEESIWRGSPLFGIQFVNL